MQSVGAIAPPKKEDSLAQFMQSQGSTLPKIPDFYKPESPIPQIIPSEMIEPMWKGMGETTPAAPKPTVPELTSQTLKTLGGGIDVGFSHLLGLKDVFAEKILPKKDVEFQKKIFPNIIKELTGEDLTDVVKDYFDKSGQQLMEEGLPEGSTAQLFVAGTGMTIPTIMTLSAMGPAGLPILSAAGFTEQLGAAGVPIGTAHGAMLHKIITASNVLPKKIRIPVLYAFGFITSQGDLKQRFADAALWGGLGGIGKEGMPLGKLKSKHRGLVTEPEKAIKEIFKDKITEKDLEQLGGAKVVADRIAKTLEVEDTVLAKRREQLLTKKYPPGILKDAENWRAVWDVTGGQGVAPYKDASGKFIELEEYQNMIPKQLRRKDSPYTPDKVAQLLGLEGGDRGLYEFLRHKKQSMTEAEYWEEKGMLMEEEAAVKAGKKERAFKLTAEEEALKEQILKVEVEKERSTKESLGQAKIIKTEAEILKATNKSSEHISEFIKNDFMDGERLREVTNEVIAGKKTQPEATKEIKGLIEDTVGAEGFRKVSVREVETRVAQLKERLGETKDLGKKRIIQADIEKLKAQLKGEKIPEILLERPEKPVEPRKPGLAVEQVEPIPRVEKFRFEDPEIEKRFEAAKGIPKPTLPQRAKDTIVSIKNKITRTYEHLPNTAEFIEAKTALKTLAKQSGRTSDSALRTLQGITIRLKRPTQDLFRRKVILDDLAREADAGHDLPFGFTKEIVTNEKARLDAKIGTIPEITDAISKRDRIWEALKNDYIHWAKKAGLDLENKLDKVDYFRHQVLEYARAKGMSVTGKRLRIPKKRGFLKERKGSEFDINTDYFEAEYEVMAQMLYDIEVYRTIDRLEQFDISKKVKADAKKQGLEDWHTAIPEGHVEWQPREGNVFYLADTIPSRIAEDILAGGLEDMGVVREALTKSLAMGRKRKAWVVKKELARTLNDLTQRKPPNWLGKLNKKILRGWKVWTLISPRRLVKYNIRNLTGDADAAFVGNPRGFKKTPQAVIELLDVYAADKPMTKEMREWFNRGGMETTLAAQELGDIKGLRIFQKFYESKGGIEKVPLKAWKKYWRTARLTTDFREAILRYANYLDYLEQIKKSPDGKPKSYGGSLREEINGLKDPRDKAFRLSNELLGPYDEISVFGQGIREHAYPFWSWKELNFRRYVRLFKNAARDNAVTSAVGRKLLTTAVKTPYLALKVGKFAVAATAFWSLCQVWNHTMYPDLEEQLPDDVKGRTHLIFGQDEDGKTIYFSRLGALGDFLEWFGLDAAPNMVSAYLSGKKSLKDIAGDMTKAPVNQVVQGLSPFIKTPMEIATRRALFPDAFDPKTIRDRGMHIARSLALENEYRAIMGKPAKPYVETLPLAAIYKSDPLEAAYHEVFDMKGDYLKKFGKRGEGFWLTPRGSALYDMKIAHRYGDKKAEQKALEDYIKWHMVEAQTTGKTREEIEKSIIQGLTNTLRNMHPLSGMNEKERIAFLESLDKGDLEVIVKAIKFYNNVLLEKTSLEE